MDTDSLIFQLSEGATAVRPLRPSWARALYWFTLSIPPLIIVITLHGLDVDLIASLGNSRFLIEELATLSTALTAAIAAFASTKPGGSRNWYWLPLVPLSVWVFTVGQACIDEWRLLGPAALTLRLDSGCLLPMILVGIVPTSAMVYMLRRGAPLSPRLSLALGMLATAALVNFGLRLFHLGDITFMVLVWHFGMLVVVTIFASFIAPSFLAWEHLAARLPASIRKR